MKYLKTKKAYLLIYKLICFILTLVTLYIIYRYGMYTWDHRTPYVEIFTDRILNEPVTKQYTMDEVLALLKQSGIAFAIFIGSLIGVHIIRRIIKAIPVPSSFVKRWDDNGEISPILGRVICAHLRGSTTIGNQELLELNNYAQGQEYYLTHAANHKNYGGILKKYDSFCKIDLEYVPEMATESNPSEVKKEVQKPEKAKEFKEPEMD